MALAGEKVPASDINLAINPPLCQARQSVGQSIPNNVATAMTFDVEDADSDGMHSTSVNTSRITCNTAGLYVVSGCAQFPANATGAREVRLIKNGATLIPGGRNSILAGSATVGQSVDLQAVFVQLAVTDYLELQAFQTSGGALVLNVVNGLFSYLAVHRLSA